MYWVRGYLALALKQWKIKQKNDMNEKTNDEAKSPERTQAATEEKRSNSYELSSLALFMPNIRWLFVQLTFHLDHEVKNMFSFSRA